jgi:Glyoxalase-like domain
VSEVAVSYQLVIDCRAPQVLALFWAEALHYVIPPPPSGFGTWDDFYRSKGVPEEQIGHGIDRIVDPQGEGPAIWFQIVPERKSLKNRIHIDVSASGRGPAESTPDELEAEAARLEALGATRVDPPAATEADGPTAIAMIDPEGNEFDVN